tara:strand:+ start:106 stop:405 length:300 start_codon:yes stop_codon:yes gene_type:complete
MSKETTPKEKTIDKETHLENNVKLQTSHLEQLFDHAEKYFEIELEQEHKDLFKSLVVKTILHKSATDELNGYYLEQSMMKSQNEKFWDKMSKEKQEELN